MRDLIDACEKAIDYRPSIETIQKDIMVMRQDPPKGFAAPIKYCRRNYVYEYTDSDYTIDNIGLNDLDIDGIKIALELINSIGSSRVSQQFAHSMEKVLLVYKEKFTNPINKKRLYKQIKSLYIVELSILIYFLRLVLKNSLFQ